MRIYLNREWKCYALILHIATKNEYNLTIYIHFQKVSRWRKMHKIQKVINL